MPGSNQTDSFTRFRYNSLPLNVGDHSKQKQAFAQSGECLLFQFLVKSRFFPGITHLRRSIHPFRHQGAARKRA